MSDEPEVKKTHRGTTNKNITGNSEDRRRRREWLVQTFRADVDVYECSLEFSMGPVQWPVAEDWREIYAYSPLIWERKAACRCYRCGGLLTVDTVTVDRIIPGCLNGTYRRDNIRPSCGSCAYVTGAQLGNARKAARKAS